MEKKLQGGEAFHKECSPAFQPELLQFNFLYFKIQTSAACSIRTNLAVSYGYMLRMF